MEREREGGREREREREILVSAKPARMPSPLSYLCVVQCHILSKFLSSSPLPQ